MVAQTERITILGSPDFKAFLVKEAKKEGVSMSELVRQRCTRKPPANNNEDLLIALAKEVNQATTRAKTALEKGLSDVDSVLAEIRRNR